MEGSLGVPIRGSPSLQQPNPDSGGSTRKKPHCSYCKNHKKKSSTRQHRCEYKEKCSCILCQLTRKAQLIMCHQQRVWRYRNQVLSDQPIIKGQKCDNCRNHSRYVKKSNHDCPYKTCDCRLCKLTFKRREIMKHIQRARRLGVTIDSCIQENPDRQDDDDEEKRELLRNGMTSLCNDSEVEMLVTATNSVSMDCITSKSESPASARDSEKSAIMNFHKSSSASDVIGAMTSSMHKSSKKSETSTFLNDIGIDRKKNIACSCDVSSLEATTSNFLSVRPKDHCPSSSRNNPHDFYSFNDSSLAKERPHNILPPPHRPVSEGDVKPPLLGSPFECHERSLDQRLPTCPISSQNLSANPLPLKLFNDFHTASSAPFTSMNPYSSFDWSPYSSPHSMLYPSYLEPPHGRQTVLRPRPIIPNRNDRSPFLLSSLFFRSPNATLHSLLPQTIRESENNALRSNDLLHAMYSRFSPLDSMQRGSRW